MRIRVREGQPATFAAVVASLATALAVAGCTRTDPQATSPDAEVIETVTNPNGTATSLPTGQAPGGDTDAAFGAAASTVVAPADAAPAMADAASSASSAPPHRPAGVAPSPAASASAAAAPACGDSPLPPCPLYAWMKANAGPASGGGEAGLPNLAIVLDKIATFAPPGYANWVSISKDGAAAARAGQLDATKASCRGCHSQYKAKYKAEMRSRPLS